MKWDETVASTCRYGDIIGTVFEGGNVIWEDSCAGYQGDANVLVFMPNGSFIKYDWSYGSCSGCDDWEHRNLSDEEIIKEVKNSMAVFNVNSLSCFLDNRSVGTKIQEIYDAYKKWIEEYIDGGQLRPIMTDYGIGTVYQYIHLTPPDKGIMAEIRVNGRAINYYYERLEDLFEEMIHMKLSMR